MSEVAARSCEYCGEAFEPDDVDQAFCKPNHRLKARKRRKREKDRLRVSQLCHTPYKRSYSSYEAYQQAGLPETQEPYTCACGAIHSATRRTVEVVAA